MKIVILESLGINDEELAKVTKPLIDSGHEIVAYEDRGMKIHRKLESKTQTY